MAKVTEVVKEIAQTWQKLGKEDRQKYKEAAKRGKKYISNSVQRSIFDHRKVSSHHVSCQR